MISREEDAREPSGADPLAFQRTLSWLLAGAGKLVLARWTDMQSHLGLTSSQHKLVLVLDELGPLGQQRLAELVGVDRRNAVPIIEMSVEQGLLIREVDPSDRRRRVLRLAPHGRRVAKRLRRLSADIEDELLAALGPAHSADLREALGKLLDGSGALRGRSARRSDTE